MSDPRLRDLRAVARRQHGLFTLAQVFAAGFDHNHTARLVTRGMWEEVAPRVYRAATNHPLRWLDRVAAATLSADALAFGPTSSSLYELIPPQELVHVLVTRSRRNLDRVRVHSTISLPTGDIAVVKNIRTTTPARTVIDTCTVLGRAQAPDLIAGALVRGLFRLPVLERRARELRAPARPGAAAVLAAIGELHPDLERARNEWEAKVLRLSRRFGLPDPVPNYEVIVGGRLRILDAAWPGTLVLTEFDGFFEHAARRRVFEDDRARQNDLVDAGWLVFRLTSGALRRNPRQAFAPIARAVERRSRGVA